MEVVERDAASAQLGRRNFQNPAKFQICFGIDFA
jgi:hypothetical protein